MADTLPVAARLQGAVEFMAPHLPLVYSRVQILIGIAVLVAVAVAVAIGIWRGGGRG